MTQVEEALQLGKTYVAIIKDRYGDYSFKRKAKKDWAKLYEFHVTNIAYLFTRDEVQIAYKRAITEIGLFCQDNAKFRK